MTTTTTTFTAEKRWGHGRLRQLRRRLTCKRWGHLWGAWHYGGEGMRSRRCQRGCGVNEMQRVEYVRAFTPPTTMPRHVD